VKQSDFEADFRRIHGDEESSDGWASHLRSLFDSLDDDRLEHIGYFHAADFRDCIEAVLTAQTAESLKEALERMHDYCMDFPRWVEVEQQESFGRWGWRFLNYVCEFADESQLEKVSRSFASPEKFYEGLENGPEDSPYASTNTPVKIDRDQFLVIEDRTWACDLGNTKPFDLICVLAESPNRYVSHIEIIEALGGDDFDISSLKTNKHRLCEALREAGCVRLPEAICARRGYYGLMLHDFKLKLEE